MESSEPSHGLECLPPRSQPGESLATTTEFLSASQIYNTHNTMSDRERARVRLRVMQISTR